MKNKTLGSGFTLMEILISVSIIAVLSVIGVTAYSSINKRSRDAKRASDMEQVRSALEMYRSDNGFYPELQDGTTNSFESLSSLDSGDGTGPLIPKYMPSIPSDPKSTDATPIPYYYAPLGASAPVYSYCLCGMVEIAPKNDCAAMGAPQIANCNYYVRNP